MGSYHPSGRHSVTEEFTLSVCDVVGTDADAFTNPSRDGLETTVFEMAWAGRTKSSCNVSRSVLEREDFPLLVVLSNNESPFFHRDFGT